MVLPSVWYIGQSLIYSFACRFFACTLKNTQRQAVRNENDFRKTLRMLTFS